MGNRFFRASISFLIAIFLAAALSVPASSHAVLVRSEPAENSVLTESPEEIRILFSEVISPEFSSARLLDINGNEIDLVKRTTDPADPYSLVLVPPELEKGLYSIHWKVLSEADGHFTQGLLVFTIGAEIVTNTAPRSQPVEKIPYVEVFLRWLNLSFMAMFIGAVVTGYALTDKVNIKGHARIGGRILAWARICAMLGLASGLAWFVYQSAVLRSGLPENASSIRVAWQLLQSTRWGNLWLLRMISLSGLALMLPYLLPWSKGGDRSGRQHDTQNRLITNPYWLAPGLRAAVLFTLIITLVVSQALAGHAAAINPNTGLAVIAAALHLLAASLWVGGLIALAVGMLPTLRQDREDFSTQDTFAWAAFTRWAALSVGVLLATGLFSAGIQIVTPDALISSLYGRALIGKIVLMLGMGVCGLFNSMLLHPSLASPFARLLHRPPGWKPFQITRLPVLVITEAALGVSVFLLAGLLSSSPPARGPGYDPLPEDHPESLSQNVDDLLVFFSAKPNLPGQNLFTIRAASLRRPEPYEVMRVILRFTYLGEDMGTISADAEEVEAGVYRLGGSFLSLPGPWQVDVVVRRRGVEDSTASFHWNVNLPGEPRPVIISNRPWGSILTITSASMLALISLTALGLWLARRLAWSKTDSS